MGIILPPTFNLYSYFLMRGYLGCFQHFAITNNAARNILCICIFLLMEVHFQGRLLEVGLLGQEESARVALPKPAQKGCPSLHSDQ